jgi:hypothetical protein
MGASDTLDALPLEAVEEASGELHRRIGVALRTLGEGGAERSDESGQSPRQRVAALTAQVELACTSIAAVAAGGSIPDARHDEHPASISAVMYAAPSIPALLGRLEQDRRMLVSLARSLDDRLAEAQITPWGQLSLRRLLSQIAIAEPARCAQWLEHRVTAAQAHEESRPDAG